MKLLRKAALKRAIKSRNGKFRKSWTVTKSENYLSELFKTNIALEHSSLEATPHGNWTVAKDWFPTIEINQENRALTVTAYETIGYQNKASIETEINFEHAGDQIFIKGEVACKNWRNYKCSGSQKFCFAIFVGDSGAIYAHRAPATKGWMNAKPETIRKRLVKLGIGATTGVYQQGDFLLKPANGSALPDEEFKHESMGSGHHKFECPVLYGHSPQGRQYLITENTLLKHHAVDGLQHPDVVIPPGKYIVGTTANQLQHTNARD